MLLRGYEISYSRKMAKIFHEKVSNNTTATEMKTKGTSEKKNFKKNVNLHLESNLMYPSPVEVCNYKSDFFLIRLLNAYKSLIGTTTTGNACRRAFASPKKFAAILGIPVEMVRNYAVILSVINAKKAKINADAFKAYCDAYLDRLYYGEFKKYSWRSLTPTVRYY